MPSARFCASIFASGRRFDLVPTRANGQPAFGAYVHGADGISHGAGLFVLALSGDRHPRHDPLREHGAPLVRPTEIPRRP